MIIAHISDSHITTEAAMPGAAPARARALAACADDINRLGADVVLHTGDMVNRGEAGEYARARAILARLKAPLLTATGNRDDRHHLAGAFGLALDGGGFLQYANDDFRLRFVAADSKDAAGNMGHVCAERLAGLDRLLGLGAQAPTVLFFHHPPFAVRLATPDQFRDPANEGALAALIGRHAQVVAVLCGHAHRRHRARWAGVDAHTTPSVAVDLRKGGQPECAGRPAYTVYRAGRDGRLAAELRVLAAPFQPENALEA